MSDSLIMRVYRDDRLVMLDDLETLVDQYQQVGESFYHQWRFFLEELQASIMKFETLRVVGSDYFGESDTPDGAVWKVVSSVR